MIALAEFGKSYFVEHALVRVRQRCKNSIAIDFKILFGNFPDLV